MILDDQITAAINEMQSIILAEKYLISIHRNILEQEEIIRKFEAQVASEYNDILVLEAKSRKVLFKSILGYDAEQLEIEKQEYLHAVLMLKDARESLTPLNFEKDILNQKISGRDLQEENLERLLRLRERTLKKDGPQKNAELLIVYKEIDELVKFNRELFEAKDIGLKCKRNLAEITALLKKAAEMRDWGQDEENVPNYHTEKSVVDVAVAKFQSLKVQLIKFEEELEDVHESKRLQTATNTIKFDLFIKAYNNHLINDWIVRKKLSSTIHLMEAMMDEVVRLLNTLDHKKTINTHKTAEKEKEKLTLIKEMS